MSQTNVALHIEELVLEGFENLDAAEVTQALEQQLTQLIMERGLPETAEMGGVIGSDVVHLNSGAFGLPPNADAQTVGGHIAETLYGGLNP